MPNNSYVRWTKIAMAASAILVLGACVSTDKPVSIQAVEANGADFSTQRTFFMLPEPPDETGKRPPRTFARQAVERAVQSEMTARRYVEIKDHTQADLLVAIQFSLKDDQKIENVVEYEYEPQVYRSYGYGRYGGYGSSGRYGGYGNYGYGSRNYYGYTAIPHTSVRVEDIRQGNMVVDIIDREENAVLWEGFARGEGEFDLDKMQARITTVVSTMFDKYPYVAALPAVADVN